MTKQRPDEHDDWQARRYQRPLIEDVAVYLILTAIFGALMAVIALMTGWL